MGWFDTPAMSIKKQVPERLHIQLNEVENFARRSLSYEPDHLLRYQLGHLPISGIPIASDF